MLPFAVFKPSFKAPALKPCLLSLLICCMSIPFSWIILICFAVVSIDSSVESSKT